MAALHAPAGQGQGQELCSGSQAAAVEGTLASALPRRSCLALRSPLRPHAALRRDLVAGVLAWCGPLLRVVL